MDAHRPRTWVAAVVCLCLTAVVFTKCSDAAWAGEVQALRLRVVVAEERAAMLQRRVQVLLDTIDDLRD